MKKKLLSLAVVSIVCSWIAEARFYIGIEGGYTGGAKDTKKHNAQLNNVYFLIPGSSTLGDMFKDKTYTSNEATYETEPWKGFNVALNLGSEHFFVSNYLGVRWGASVGFTEIMRDSTEKSATGSVSYTDTLGYIDAGLSFDVMINFIARPDFSFGIFGGVEGDCHYMVVDDQENSITNKIESFLSKVTSRHAMDVSGRVGVSTLMGKHHRIDLTAKLPIGYVVASADNKVKIASGPVKASFNVGYKYVF